MLITCLCQIGRLACYFGLSLFVFGGIELFGAFHLHGGHVPLEIFQIDQPDVSLFAALNRSAAEQLADVPGRVAAFLRSAMDKNEIAHKKWQSMKEGVDKFR